MDPLQSSSEEVLRSKCNLALPPHRATPFPGLDRLVGRVHDEWPRDLSFPNARDGGFPTWKNRGLAELRKELIIPGSLGKPVDAIVKDRVDHRDFIEEQIEFAVTPPLRAPATAAIPKNGKERHPAIVILHCMGSLLVYGRERLLAFEGEPAFLTKTRVRFYEGRSLLEEFARRGYLAIAIDAFNFGMRTVLASEDPEEFDKSRRAWTEEEAGSKNAAIRTNDEIMALRALNCAGLSLAALIATDDLRTVDYLCSRSDVDAGRIGCTGLSFGSFRANYLCALDERVKAAASVCWLSAMSGILDYNIHGAMGFFALPVPLYGRMDMTDIVGLAAPKPFLAISGWKDRLMQPFGIARAHLRYREIWEAAGAADKLVSIVDDVPHEYNIRMQQTALAFFDRNLA